MDANFLALIGPIYLKALMMILGVFAVVMLVTLPRQLKQLDEVIEHHNKTRA
jgi:hypothetical protein